MPALPVKAAVTTLFWTGFVDVADSALSTSTPPLAATSETLFFTYSTVVAALVSASVGVFTPVSSVGVFSFTSEISSVKLLPLPIGDRPTPVPRGAFAGASDKKP